MIYTVSSSNFDGNGEIKEQSMNLKEAGRIGEDAFLKAGITDGLTDARLLLEWVTGISLAEYAMNPFQPMTTEQERRYLELVEKRRRRVPLQHLTGEQEFMGLIFRVSPDVLIPRQDTELLTEEALKRLRPGMNVLDLCTGSGCIIVSLEQIGKSGVLWMKGILLPEVIFLMRRFRLQRSINFGIGRRYPLLKATCLRG